MVVLMVMQRAREILIRKVVLGEGAMGCVPAWGAIMGSVAWPCGVGSLWDAIELTMLCENRLPLQNLGFMETYHD